MIFRCRSANLDQSGSVHLDTHIVICLCPRLVYDKLWEGLRLVIEYLTCHRGPSLAYEIQGQEVLAFLTGKT